MKIRHRYRSIKRILLDIDDVCNYCTKYALQWLGVPFDYDHFYEKYPTDFGYDIVSSANMILGHRRFTEDSFWWIIPRQFWASAPISAEFHYLFARCEDLVGREGICFLTGPTKDPDSLAGKLEWIQRVAPPWMHRQYLVGPPKQFCAHPEALLIDDSDANVDRFRDWGGNAILVPRPWNTLNGVDTMAHLEAEFSRYLKKKEAA